MDSRPATPQDVDAIVELHRRWDIARFGQPEHDADEVRETFGGEDTFAERSRLLVDGDRLLAAAWFWSAETTLLVDPDVDPDVDPAPLYADVLPWLATRAEGLDALSEDASLRAALQEQGWTHHHSSFELIRTVGDDWSLAEPVWPDGVTLTDLQPSDVEAVHRLIYMDAAWAEVPGHPARAFEQWRDIFVTDKELPDQQVLAWRADRLIGVSMGRTFSDGAGWVAQLAVAKDARGQGLGRALLLESFHRRVAAGATLLGLSVEAANRTAIGLYLDVGLRLDREWQKFLPPSTQRPDR